MGQNTTPPHIKSIVRRMPCAAKRGIGPNIDQDTRDRQNRLPVHIGPTLPRTKQMLRQYAGKLVVGAEIGMTVEKPGVGVECF